MCFGAESHQQSMRNCLLVDNYGCHQTFKYLLIQKIKKIITYFNLEQCSWDWAFLHGLIESSSYELPADALNPLFYWVYLPSPPRQWFKEHFHENDLRHACCKYISRFTPCLLKCFVLALNRLNPQNRTESPQIKPNIHDSFVRIEVENW